MRIVLLGPPGSGKGELAERIAKAYDIPIVTQASIVDAVAAESGELGRLAAEARDAARVSDELLLALLRIQLPKLDLSRGYLLVDMPRDAGQADVLDAMLNDLGKPVDLAIKLDVDMDELMERLVGRVQCDHCGALYNMYVNPPLVDGVCDECGARVRRRPPDYEETISNRLRVYEGQMGPLLQYYQQAGKLHRFDATGEVEPLWRQVKAVIDATPSPDEASAAVVSVTDAKVEAGSAKSKSATAADQKTVTGKVSKKETTKKTVEEAAAKKVTKNAAKKTVANKAAKKVAKKAAAKKTAKKAAAKKVAKKTTKKAAVKKVAKKVAKKAAAKKTAKKAAKKVAGKKTAGKRSRR